MRHDIVLNRLFELKFMKLKGGLKILSIVFQAIKRALIEMPVSLKYGKIIKLMSIFPHFNKPLEKSSNGCLTFPHYNKAFFKRVEVLIFKIKEKSIRFAHIKKHTIPSTFFSFTTWNFFCKMSGRNQSDWVDGITGIRSIFVVLNIKSKSSFLFVKLNELKF